MSNNVKILCEKIRDGLFGIENFSSQREAELLNMVKKAEEERDRAIKEKRDIEEDFKQYYIESNETIDILNEDNELIYKENRCLLEKNEKLIEENNNLKLTNKQNKKEIGLLKGEVDTTKRLAQEQMDLAGYHFEKRQGAEKEVERLGNVVASLKIKGIKNEQRCEIMDLNKKLYDLLRQNFYEKEISSMMYAQRKRIKTEDIKKRKCDTFVEKRGDINMFSKETIEQFMTILNLGDE